MMFLSWRNLQLLLFVLTSWILFIGCQDDQPEKIHHADVCIYGGTASGVLAAVSAAGEGCRVIIVEPSRWLGGMTGGGISRIDWGNEEAVGGTTLKILEKRYNNFQFRQVFLSLQS